MNFYNKYLDIVKKNNSYVCVGLDTDIKKIPQCLKSADNPMLEFNKQIIDATKDYVAAYKPNFAFYISEGITGIKTLKETIAYIPSHIPVIIDIKAGDIGNTMEQYAKSMFCDFKCDAITINPLMGADVFDACFKIKDAYVFALALTSNPSAKDFFKHHELSDKIATTINSYGVIKTGAVVGATQTQDLTKMRNLMPETIFLIPGVGAQGGDLEKVVQLAKHNAQNPNFLINSSRGIIYANNCQTEEFAQKAQEACLNLKNQINKLLLT